MEKRRHDRSFTEGVLNVFGCYSAGKPRHYYLWNKAITQYKDEDKQSTGRVHPQWERHKEGQLSCDINKTSAVQTNHHQDLYIT